MLGIGSGHEWNEFSGHSWEETGYLIKQRPNRKKDRKSWTVKLDLKLS